jgi:hypothetical protein
MLPSVQGDTLKNILYGTNMKKIQGQPEHGYMQKNAEVDTISPRDFN